MALDSERAGAEDSLIEKARTDRLAFGALYEAYYSRILNYIYRCTLNRSLAEELTSNTFFKALRSLGTYLPRTPFRCWLYRIATNEVRMHSMRKGIVLLSILVGAGALAWAAQQAWRVFIVPQSDLNGPLVVQADGSVGAGASMVSVTSNDPNFTQAKADEQWAKMKQAIADGKFKLRETRETNGTLVYLYDITLPDGKVVGFGSNRPMEEIQTEEQSDSPDE